MLNLTLRNARFVFYSIIPAVLVYAAAETVVRLAGLDRPSIIAGGLANIGQDTLVRTDALLGWSMRPGFSGTIGGDYTVTTNSLGLRSPQVPAAKGAEFRILSLGESTTFGLGVGDHETYSRRLEEILNQSSPPRPVRVINAGVSAYSSTQSLLYLEERGLKLEPDLILVYHEVNDYLPSTIRDTKLSEAEVTRTDRQLYRSRIQKLNRLMLNASALYRFLAYSYSRRRLERYDRSRLDVRTIPDPLGEIGFPRFMTPSAAAPSEVTKEGVRRADRFIPLALGRRVSEAERRENFEELWSISTGRGIPLIIIHPAYRIAQRHECVLTRFCRERGALLFEAYDSLHPDGETPTYMFLDDFHPTAYGHDKLARDLAAFIRDKVAGLETRIGQP